MISIKVERKGPQIDSGWSKHHTKNFNKIKELLEDMKVCPWCGWIGDQPQYHGSLLDGSWTCPVKLLYIHIEDYINVV
jgi:hypothetical protein